MMPVSTSPVPPVAMPGIAGRIDRRLGAVGDHGAMPFEHHDSPGALGQFAGQVFALVERTIFWRPVRRANSPGCGVRILGPPAFCQHIGLLRQRVERVGVDDHRLRQTLVQPADDLDQFLGLAQPRSAGHGRGFAVQLRQARAPPRRRSDRGIARQCESVIRLGSNAATVAWHAPGVAIFTSPAPLRSAAMPASAIAPAMPCDPPIKSARPKSPL